MGFASSASGGEIHQSTGEKDMPTQSAPVMEMAITDEIEQAQQTSHRSHSLRHDALLVLITLIWGSTFLIVKNAVSLIGPFTYLALSYSIGSLTLALLFHRRLRRITRAELLSGLVLGMILFTAYALQTIGLQYTTVSKAGFITGLYVPLVPVFAFLLLRQRPTQGAIVGIALSFSGLFWLSFNDKFNLAFGPGETLILGAAITFALHIVSVSKFAPHVDAINLAVVQLTLTSLLSFIAIPIAREPFIMPPMVVWGSVLFMGVMDVAFTLSMMIWIQQIVSGTRAALIYALEPMWAALFGFMLAGDKLGLLAWIGCGFILSGLIIGRMGKLHLSLRKSTK
jgi:drug/metabolite transporter (DMT)-like permease